MHLVETINEMGRISRVLEELQSGPAFTHPRVAIEIYNCRVALGSCTEALGDLQALMSPEALQEMKTTDLIDLKRNAEATLREKLKK